MAAPAAALVPTRTSKPAAKAATSLTPSTNQAAPQQPTRQLHPLHPALPANPFAIPADAPEGRDPHPTEAEGKPLRLQRKLAVGASDDPLEAEADRAANAVMQMQVPSPASGHAPVSTPFHSQQYEASVRRKCACGSTCDKCKEEQNELLQRKATDDIAPMQAPDIVHDVLRSPGRPLDAETRSFMEARFAQDFSHIRIHTDAAAANSASAVNALAYTVGHQIVFGAGQYAPATSTTRRLLAHELAHTVQQGQSEAASPSANRPAAAAPVARSAPVSVQRQESPQSTDDLTIESIVKQGMSLKKSVDQTHWGSEADKWRFIRHFLRYTRKHDLTAQYEQALADYPDALPGSALPVFEVPPPTPPPDQPPASTAHTTPLGLAPPKIAPSASPAVRSGPDPSEWTMGPRGEHLPTSRWRGGPLRPIASYTKPWAQELARAGNYEAAELAENYLCASCHILTKVDPKDFDITGYSQAWQANYIKGSTCRGRATRLARAGVFCRMTFRTRGRRSCGLTARRCWRILRQASRFLCIRSSGRWGLRRQPASPIPRRRG